MMSFRSSSLRSLGELRDRASAQLKQYSPYGHAAASWLGSDPDPIVKELKDRPNSTTNHSENSEVSEPASASGCLFQFLHLELAVQLAPNVLEVLGTQVGQKLVCLNPRWPLILDNDSLAVFVQKILWQALFGRKAEKLKRAAMAKHFDGYLIETRLFPWMRGCILDKSTAFMKGLLIGVIRELTNVPEIQPKVHVEHQEPKLFRFFFGVPCVSEIRDHPDFVEHLRLYRQELESIPYFEEDSESTTTTTATSHSSSAETPSSESSLRSQTNRGSREGSSGISEDFSCGVSFKVESNSEDPVVNFGTPSRVNGWANEGFLWTDSPTEEHSKL